MITNNALTPTRNEELTIDTSSKSIALATYDRKVLVIRNTGTTNITLSFGNKIGVANEGILMQPNESVTDVKSEGYKPWQGTIQAISDVAGGKLSIFER